MLQASVPKVLTLFCGIGGKGAGNEMTVAFDYRPIVPLIYDAGLGHGSWQQVLDALIELYGGHCGSFICRRPDGSGGRSVEIGFDPRAIEQFFGYFATRNPLLQRGLHRAVGTVVSDQDVMPKAELRRTEYYNDLLMKQEDTNAILTAYLWRDNERFVVFNCNRSVREPEYDAADKSALRPLLVHFRRAIEIALRLGTLESTPAPGAQLYDGALHGIIIADELGTVLYANAVAERLLAEADGLTAGVAGLAAATPAASAALATMLARAASGCDGGTLALPRPRRGRPLYVIAAPLPEETLWLQPARRRVLLLLRDPAERAELEEQDLRSLFGLTPAEARLTLLLYRGEELAAAAAALGISPHTARAHLNAILAKTESNRQAELMRRLVTVAELTGRRPPV
jgi:DNA-binding CsgD family transcriptional regulator